MKKIYRKARKGEIPDVTEKVKYDGESWRVSGYLKRNPKYIWNLIWCVREEAELVELTGVCGTIVKPVDIERSFELVPWPMELIRQAREQVIRFANSNDSVHVIKSRDYLDDIPEEPSLKERIDAVLTRNGTFGEILSEILK